MTAPSVWLRGDEMAVRIAVLAADDYSLESMCPVLISTCNALIAICNASCILVHPIHMVHFL